LTTQTASRSLFAVVVGEPLSLAKDQPHQVLLSTGSVAIMAQFAAHGGIVHPAVGYCIAVGVEWAYLRGLASDSRAQSHWGAALNWSAFAIVVLWGVLWVATIYKAIPERPGGGLALALGAAHIVPIAWLALCSAMCHRTAVRADALAAGQAAREHEVWEREQAEKDRELLRWKEAQRLKSEIKIAERSVTETPVVTGVTAVSRSVTTPDRAALRVAVVTAYKTQGESLNVSQEAKRLGIGRGLWYKLRDEARGLGEM